MKSMYLSGLLAAGLVAMAALSSPTVAATAVTEQEAHAIGVDAYIYFYPLVTMDLTRKQSTNIEAGKEFGKGPTNMFVNVPEYPPADLQDRRTAELRHPVFRCLARSDQGANDRFCAGYRRPLLLAAHARHVDRRIRLTWLANHRHAGGQLPRYTAGLERRSSVGNDAHRRADALCLDHRANQDGWAAGLRCSPQDSGGLQSHADVGVGQSAAPPELTIDPTVDMKTPPKVQVDNMPAGKFFAYAAELLKVNPPHITDQPIIAQMKQIGIEPRQELRLGEGRSRHSAMGLDSAPEDAQQLMAWKVPTLARVTNGWSMNTDTMGVYGNYYLKRAIVAQLGLGANLPEDAIYPFNLGDDSGKPLDGANKYTIHFDNGATPPVNAFWSITLYDAEGFQVANPSIGLPSVAGCLSSITRTVRSISIFRTKVLVRARRPTGFQRRRGRSTLTLRIYAPKSEALTGKWNSAPGLAFAGSSRLGQSVGRSFVALRLRMRCSA